MSLKLSGKAVVRFVLYHLTYILVKDNHREAISQER